MADVILSITVPDAYVSRLSEAITNSFDCEGLGAKACAEKEIRNYLKRIIRQYEGDQIMTPAIQARDALEDITIE